jgi:predicted O-methyltransferase YrrM
VSFDTVLARLDGVEGWLTDAQARRLWEAAGAVSAPGRIVEIGSFRGRSTIVLASAAAEGVELLAIDPHGGSDRGPQEIAADAGRGEQDHEAFTANLGAAGVQDRVTHVRARSDQALALLAGRVELLYVDGAHRYRPARADIEDWGARVIDGGTMLIHDSFNAVGVTLAQLSLLVPSGRWRYLGRTGSLAAYRRERLGPAARAGNALRQLAGLGYFTRNLAIKVSVLVLRRDRAGNWPY